jgi:tetratricopeptide (TPR) repeat protein
MVRYFLAYVKNHTGDVERSESYRALELEHTNIFASLYWCYETGRDVEVERANLWGMFIEFSDRLADYLWARGYWAERVDICQKAYEACKLLDDWEGAGRQAYAIGWVHWEQRNMDQAQSWAVKCQQAMKQANRPEGLSLAKHLLGLVAMRREEYESADTYFIEALDLASPDRIGVGSKASILNELGHLYRLQDKLQEAKAWYEKSAAEAERVGFVEGIGITKGYLALTLFLVGQVEQAETLYREALKTALEVGRASTIARIHRGLAELLLQKGELAEAREHALAAISVDQRLERGKELEVDQALLMQIEAAEGKSSTA